MQEYFPAPERRYPSPSAQRRSGEHWKARLGLAMVVVLTLCSAAIMFRIAGLGVGAAISPFRGPALGGAARPAQGTAPAGQPPAGQPTAANQPAGQPTAGSQPAATAPAAAPPTAGPTTPAGAAPAPTVAVPSPTTRPGQ